MNRLLWIVPLALPLIGAGAGYYQGQNEPYAYAYRNLVEGWPRFSPWMQSRIKVIMADGKMSEWEWQGLENDALKEAGYFMGSTNMPDVESGRNRLIKLIQNSTN